MKSKPLTSGKPPRTVVNRLAADPWADAVAHLSALGDPWPGRIAHVGPCQLRPRRDRFAQLVRAIVSQQISTKAAQSIEARLLNLGGGVHHPKTLIELGPDMLRTAGLSGVKAQYVLNLAQAVHSEELPLQRAGRWSDEEVITRLTQIKGIGRWTAEMFLIFSLNRPDVLPVGDLGVRSGIQRHFSLSEMPDPKTCHQLTEPWRPYRSVAIWYLWREKDAPAPTA